MRNKMNRPNRNHRRKKRRKKNVLIFQFQFRLLIFLLQDVVWIILRLLNRIEISRSREKRRERNE